VESTINQVVSKRFVKSSRCSGRCGAHTYCYRRGPKYLTTTLRTSSAAGTQSFMLRRLDPRFFDALSLRESIGSSERFRRNSETLCSQSICNK
jgi:hypothetical protein